MNRIRPFLARAASIAVLAGTSGLVGAGSLEPPAGPVAPTMKTLSEVEPRTPIHQSDLPLTIDDDGAYYLAENLIANQDAVDMITVVANYVSIDLNGFTIDGAGPGVTANDCIRIEQEVRTFELTDGFIRGCDQNGVIAENPFALTATVDRVHSNQNGAAGMHFGPGSYGVVTRSAFRANGSRGVLVAEGVIADTVAFSNGTIGLQVNYGVINGCTARSNAGNAIVLFGGTVVDTYAP